MHPGQVKIRRYKPHIMLGFEKREFALVWWPPDVYLQSDSQPLALGSFPGVPFQLQLFSPKNEKWLINTYINVPVFKTIFFEILNGRQHSIQFYKSSPVDLFQCLIIIFPLGFSCICSNPL